MHIEPAASRTSRAEGDDGGELALVVPCNSCHCLQARHPQRHCLQSQKGASEPGFLLLPDTALAFRPTMQAGKSDENSVLLPVRANTMQQPWAICICSRHSTWSWLRGSFAPLSTTIHSILLVIWCVE